jgi:septum formation inhibitor-activating ATPase MinD
MTEFIKREEVNFTPALWIAFVAAATDFVTANPEVLAVMIAGAVIGLIAMAVKRLSKAGR